MDGWLFRFQGRRRAAGRRLVHARTGVRELTLLASRPWLSSYRVRGAAAHHIAFLR
jgi:hypothetical protein